MDGLQQQNHSVQQAFYSHHIISYFGVCLHSVSLKDPTSIYISLLQSQNSTESRLGMLFVVCHKQTCMLLYFEQMIINTSSCEGNRCKEKCYIYFKPREKCQYQCKCVPMIIHILLLTAWCIKLPKCRISKFHPETLHIDREYLSQ